MFRKRPVIALAVLMSALPPLAAQISTGGTVTGMHPTRGQSPLGGMVSTFEDAQEEAAAAVEAIAARAADLLDALALTLEDAEALNAALFARTFGMPFVPEETGLLSLGPPGPFVPATYLTVGAPNGVTVELRDFVAYPFTTLPREMLDPTGTGFTSIEALTYSARFGEGPSHGGLAIRFADSRGSSLAFAPIFQAPEGALIHDSTIAQFLQLVGDVPTGTEIDMVQILLESPSTVAVKGKAPKTPPQLPWDLEPCDEAALDECLAAVGAAYQDALSAAENAHRQKVNQRLNEYRESLKQSVVGGAVGGAAAGAVPGAIEGAKVGLALGGPWGMAAGILVGGLVGALAGGATGGAAGLTWEAFSNDCKEDLDRYADEFRADACAATQVAVGGAQACVDAHCPALSAAAADILATMLATMVAQMGC